MINLLRRLFNPYRIDDETKKEIDELRNQTEYLFVGLGNPGSRYAGNRHNIGWMVINQLCAKRKKEPISYSSSYFMAPLRMEGKAVLAVMPSTFMNKSGEAVAPIAKRFAIPVNRIVVVCDEYNFPTGRLHLKQGGSDGGHNGLSSVIEHLGSDNFYRLRCGIDKNFEPGGMADYVLSDFPESEFPARNEMIKNAVTALEHIVRAGTARAMSEINSGKLFG